MKLLIVGGVAGGASAAARARRLDENAEIILFERGEYISFANCGLPYHIGKEISDRESLLVMTPEKFNGRADIDIRIKNEITGINPKEKTVSVRNIEKDNNYTESYDKLILSPGSSPLVPPVPGAGDPDINVLWTIPDMDRIMKKVDSGIKHAVVVGGGFIGIEVIENLRKRGVDTALVEMLPQVFPVLDSEMTEPIKSTLELNDVSLHLDNAVTEVNKTDNGYILKLKDNTELKTDMVIFSAGIRPNSELAKNAGLKTNEQGGIVVNEYMQTSDSDIYAVGDAVQIENNVLKKPTMVPLAGPANRQGRIAADNVFGNKTVYNGSIGTSVCKIFDFTAAATGVNEKELKKDGVSYNKFYIAPNSNASYYPGSALLYIKIIHNQTGEIIGAQVVGQKGVDKRIDLLAAAVKQKMTFSDLEELELAYAPPYGSAKDPINFVGYVGSNILKGNTDIVNPDSIPEEAFLLDIRDRDEVLCGTIDGAVNIPLGELRSRLNEIPKEREIIVFCKMGARGYLAELIMRSNGFKVKNLSGGYEFWKLFNPSKNNLCEDSLTTGAAAAKAKEAETANEDITEEDVTVSANLNACGLQCPGPILKVKENIEKMKYGEVLKVSVNDMGFIRDITSWCNSTGNKLLNITKENEKIEALIQKGKAEVAKNTVDKELQKQTSIVLFSNDLDKAIAAMIIASGFASLGHKVSIFFTFWGINVLRKDNPPALKKNLISKMFGFMMPKGPKKLALSKMHMMGLGTGMMKHVMKMKNINSLPELMQNAQELGVKFLACEMAMNMMGIKEEELIDNVERAGVANFAELSEKSSGTLFI
ncbi:MAG: FAD-dependent oxidoreductase [Victivallales bacterium]|nr:FAD-dependent oxidoreductase [Victivallales bacterium]